jgi:hypothetical protein
MTDDERQTLQEVWVALHGVSAGASLDRDYASKLATDLHQVIQRYNKCSHANHQPGERVAFMTASALATVFKEKPEIFGCPVIADDSITDGLIHFPQLDGSCQKYNI